MNRPIGRTHNNSKLGRSIKFNQKPEGPATAAHIRIFYGAIGQIGEGRLCIISERLFIII